MQPRSLRHQRWDTEQRPVYLKEPLQPDGSLVLSDRRNRLPQPKPSLVLPRLNPVDCYYLYNPDGFYRME